MIKEIEFRLGLSVRLFGVTMEEEWKTVKYQDGIEISNKGRVRSWLKGTSKKRRFKPFFRALDVNKNHFQVHIKGKNRYVHLLVLEGFGQKKPSKKHECCHNDGNPINNNISNLRWGTRRENQLDRKKHGVGNEGERHGMSVLKNNDILEMRRIRKNGTMYKDIGKIFNVAASTVGQIIRNERWTHI